jgi:cation-transporting ATPase E
MVIGIPSFVLALAPNTERVQGQFFRRVAQVSIPSGVIAGAATLIGYEIARSQRGLSVPQERTTAVLILAGVSLLVVIRTAAPFVMWKAVLVVAMGVALFAVIVTPVGRDYFDLHLPSAELMLVVAGLIVASGVALAGSAEAVRRLTGP